MARRSARVLGVVGSTLVALVLSHSLVFLVRYGSAYGEALAHAGHDLAWTIAVVSSGALGASLALAGLFQLRRLNARGAMLGSSVGRTDDPRPGLISRWLTTSGRLAATTAILLTIQENVERAGVGLPAPGIGLLLSADYPWAVCIVVAVGFAVGLVISLFRWRRDVLVARLRAARQVERHAVAAPAPTWIPLRPVASVLGRAQGLRAPPRALAS
jgi:hypothetical protein